MFFGTLYLSPTWPAAVNPDPWLAFHRGFDRVCMPFLCTFGGEGFQTAYLGWWHCAWLLTMCIPVFVYVCLYVFKTLYIERKKTNTWCVSVYVLNGTRMIPCGRKILLSSFTMLRLQMLKYQNHSSDWMRPEAIWLGKNREPIGQRDLTYIF